jgi:acyl dehydratase
MQLNLDVVGRTFEGPAYAMDWQRAALYALGIGAGTEALDFTWEGSPNFQVYPSFAVIPTQPLVFPALTAIGADYRTLVHGEQTIRIHEPIPAKGDLRSTARIPAVYDKGKAAVVLIETQTFDASGRLLAETLWSIFCRGQGGFGGEAGPAPTLPVAAEGATPAFEASCPTSPAQALLYRLSGDHNPLHVDPALATKVGFEAPILHGLCTYGMATRESFTACAAAMPPVCGVSRPGSAAWSIPAARWTCAPCPRRRPGTWLVEARVGDRSVLSHGVVEIG